MLDLTDFLDTYIGEDMILKAVYLLHRSPLKVEGLRNNTSLVK